MDEIPYEIERKYLIRRPDAAWLGKLPDRSEIVQTYLVEPEGGGRARVRMRRRNGITTCTYTIKRRVNELRAIELEREISPEEYDRLLKQADPTRAPIHKTRCCLPYCGQLFEIDLYPFWNDRAIMEIELKDESQAVLWPPEIELIREVSSDRRYSNAALAKWLAKTGGEKGWIE